MKRTRGLNTLAEGNSGYVSEILTKGGMRRRLFDIGLIPGTRVVCLQRALFGDPTAFLIRGAVIALREEDSKDILIKPL